MLENLQKRRSLSQTLSLTCPTDCTKKAGSNSRPSRSFRHRSDNSRNPSQQTLKDRTPIAARIAIINLHIHKPSQRPATRQRPRDTDEIALRALMNRALRVSPPIISMHPLLRNALLARSSGSDHRLDEDVALRPPAVGALRMQYHLSVILVGVSSDGSGDAEIVRVAGAFVAGVVQVVDRAADARGAYRAVVEAVAAVGYVGVDAVAGGGVALR